MLKFTIDSNESVFVPDDGDSDNGDQDPNQILFRKCYRVLPQKKTFLV